MQDFLKKKPGDLFAKPAEPSMEMKAFKDHAPPIVIPDITGEEKEGQLILCPICAQEDCQYTRRT